MYNFFKNLSVVSAKFDLLTIFMHCHAGIEFHILQYKYRMVILALKALYIFEIKIGLVMFFILIMNN
jgi:hypothetical protein